MKFLLLTATDGNSPILVGFGHGGAVKVQATDDGTEIFNNEGTLIDVVRESCREILNQIKLS